jgi:hypothetical protein
MRGQMPKLERSSSLEEEKIVYKTPRKLIVPDRSLRNRQYPGLRKEPEWGRDVEFAALLETVNFRTVSMSHL